MGVILNPHKPAGGTGRTLTRARRPDFHGRCRGLQQSRKEKKAIGVDLGSNSSSVSSGWMYVGPEIEAQVASEGPAHPCHQGRGTVGMVDPATVEGATGTKDGAQRDSGCCVPPALLSELKGKASRASAHSTALPEWGCFRPVVLPTRASSTRTHFEEKLGPPDGSKFGEGRSYRFDVSTSLGKETPLGSPRARQHAILLSAAMRNILYGVKSSPGAGRERLSKAHAVASDDSNSVLRLASGARLGLCVISALEDVVVDEGKVFDSCFRELVWQERSACRQRGELLEVMRGHYAKLLEEVVEHLSRLKASLEHTVGEEERLKQQSYSVKRIAKLLAEDAKVNDDHRQKLASMAPTELDRYIADRHGSIVATADHAVGPTINAADKDSGVRKSSTTCDGSDEDMGGKPVQRESVESLEGLLSEVRSGPPEEERNINAMTERARHVMASLKVDMLQEMIEERVAARREQDRRDRWRQYNAATTIKNWWRRVNPPEWEEADRQYAATLIQAHIRAKIARLTRKRVLEHFRVTRGAIALQNMYRRYLAVRERKRRAQIVRVALVASFRTLDKAVGHLEAKASAMQTAEQASKTAKTSPDPKGGSSKGTPFEQVCAESAAGGAATGHVGEAGENVRERTISSLVRRLQALGQVLEQWEDGRCRNVSEELNGEDGRRSRQNSAASSSSVAGVGRRRVARRRP